MLSFLSFSKGDIERSKEDLGEGSGSKEERCSMVGPPSMGQSSSDTKEVSLLHLFVLVCYSIKDDWPC